MIKEYQIIEVQQIQNKVLEQMLRDWMNLYKSRLSKSSGFKIKSFPKEIKTIESFEMLSSDLFCFLINYLKYPEKISHNGKVSGFVKSKKAFFKEITERELMIYNFEEKNETELDNVKIISEKQSIYKYDFNGSISRIYDNKGEIKYRKARLKGFTNIKTIKIQNPIKSEIIRVQILKKFFKRVLILVPIILFCLMSFWFFEIEINQEKSSMFILGIGMFFWIVMEHELLKYIKIYIILLFLSISFFLFNFWLEGKNAIKVSDWMAFLPISFLILQILFRNVFILLFNKEPEFDRTSRDFRNIIYTLLLAIGAILLNLAILVEFVT